MKTAVHVAVLRVGLGDFHHGVPHHRDEDYLRQLNPQARLECYGQEYNPESYVICGSDLMMKGQDLENIKFGDSFTADGLAGIRFDYLLANPPFGVEWKPEERFIRSEAESLGYDGRFGAGLPRINALSKTSLKASRGLAVAACCSASSATCLLRGASTDRAPHGAQVGQAVVCKAYSECAVYILKGRDMTDLIPRTLSTTLRRLAGPNPVVYLTGPRQSGKTTLARATFPDFAYVNLEDLQRRAAVKEDPLGFLRDASGEAGVIVDEAQRVPELFSYLQQVVDERRAGPFILTGSQQFLLGPQVSQSLAGRAAVLQLLPFSTAELRRRPALTPDAWSEATPGSARSSSAVDEGPTASAGAPSVSSLDEVLFTGMYPAIHDRGLEASQWLDSYVAAYVERDARLAGAIGDLSSFTRFVALCAGRSGQLVNLTSLGSDAGVSRVTASRWLSVLSASYIVTTLQPHHENFSRRLVKTPKLYFLDTGLMCALLGVRKAADLRGHPLRGAMFETFVVSELTKLFLHHGERAPLYFWRDSNGTEVDVLVDLGASRIPVEAKAGVTVAADAFRGLETYEGLAASAAERAAAEGRPGYATDRSVLVHGGDDWYVRRGHDVRPWWACT